MDIALKSYSGLLLGEGRLSRLIGVMILQIIANLSVAFERVKIIWKPEGKTQDTVDNPRSEEEGPAAVTPMPGVIREGCQVTASDAPTRRTWLILAELIEHSGWKPSRWNLLDFRRYVASTTVPLMLKTLTRKAPFSM